MSHGEKNPIEVLRKPTEAIRISREGLEPSFDVAGRDLASNGKVNLGGLRTLIQTRSYMK